jgi:sulfite exporter TauE/SafE
MSEHLLITVLAASLLGSTHCAGMCGPFVVLIAGAQRDRSFPFRLAAYHVGRLTTYLALGFAAGVLGASLNLAGSLYGWQQLAAYVAGTAMLVTAGGLLLRQLGLRWRHLPMPERWLKLIHAGFRRVASWPAVPRAYLIGLLTTLLPCGWLYAFVLVAAGLGDVGHACLIMLAFWTGTLPLLSLLGWSTAAAAPAPRVRAALPWVSLAACLILGVSLITGRAAMRLDAFDPLSSSQHSATTRARLVETIAPPCCSHDHDEE